MKTILCYGDSNTWGFVPGSFEFIVPYSYMKRYSRYQRWTGLLQQKLGNEYYVIEEGLNGRTTNLDYPSLPLSRNGKTFLPTCLYSHAPLDLIVLMLGGNDLKIEFNRSSQDIANGISELIELIQQTNYGPDMRLAPQILLIGEPHLAHEEGFAGQFKGAMAKARELNPFYQRVAEKYNCHYADASEQIQFSEIDGIHLDAEGHRRFAEWIYPKIIKLLD